MKQLSIIKSCSEPREGSSVGGGLGRGGGGVQVLLRVKWKTIMELSYENELYFIIYKYILCSFHISIIKINLVL